MLQPDESIAARRLSELRAAQPGDATLRNLLEVLNAKLELAARLPIYEYEASCQGHVAATLAFSRLIDLERRAFNEAIAALRQHMDETNAAGMAAAPASEGTAA